MKPYLLSTLIVLSSTAFANDLKSGGDTSVKKEGPNAFSLPAANLPMSKRLDFSVGNSFFRNPWVSAPASTDARDGLGPLFNTNGCQNCHIKDGRGHPPEKGDSHAVSMLVRLSIPALTAEQKKAVITSGVIPEPTYGGQLQDFALQDQKPEGQISIRYSDVPVTFSDGTTVVLRKPTVEIRDLAYGEMHPQTLLSARVAPPMIGLGLLESIAEETLLQWADEDALNQDGISGKLNKVWDVQTQSLAIGRFGWKAGQPTLMQQNAAAFNGDLGLTSHLFPQENCTDRQDLCRKLPNGGSPEVSDNILDFVEFYSQHLAVPIRRNVNDPQVKLGETLFVQSGCESCHKQTVKTAKREALPALSEQTIHPYTDLLLHDMGPGLADNRPEYLANGQEWRTPPLWGIGYTQEVNDHTYFLHDGRARNLMEAVLWHGGEAEAAKQNVLKMSAKERDALIAFLNSL
ncbi:di-heme oxidoreductase family protein [Vibrio vulnificus]|uniref:di-heme oxidoreductase family protein n=1 Tax=Vibrio vulnificus TaxID=672 RepID=UPI0001F5C198|nr:di-heme oxidoredictase family protein [Vibrio vulnificus]ADV86928.1 probable thiol oxidoreductase with 2 cytochrome c heme-binding sites [Vibrio vulnificus MO6-24/O]ARN66312.1 putative thiol oxidoreductase with 2 cytochrome c heme-binding sites [Vibrio vulnificus]EGR0040835.1 c-type cytochrome [Vibrio vulnificus]EGR0090062.1 c-type cytochrome [Vibrio vulnificus]EGR0098016.1 c-type cytochrome [Vibrio vulnificus]